MKFMNYIKFSTLFFCLLGTSLFAEDWKSETHFKEKARSIINDADQLFNEALSALNSAKTTNDIDDLLKDLTKNLPRNPHATDKINILEIEKKGGNVVESVVSFAVQTDETPFREMLNNLFTKANDFINQVDKIVQNGKGDITLPELHNRKINARLNKLKDRLEHFIKIFVHNLDKLKENEKTQELHANYQNARNSLEKVKRNIDEAPKEK